MKFIGSDISSFRYLSQGPRRSMCNNFLCLFVSFIKQKTSENIIVGQRRTLNTLQNFSQYTYSLLSLIRHQKFAHYFHLKTYIFHDNPHIGRCPKHNMTSSKFYKLNLLFKNCTIFQFTQ